MISAHGVVISVVLACSLAGAAAGQEVSQPAAAPDSEAVPLAGMSPDELDVLVAPVALFPDALLSQILMASTYPFDVVKADRLLSQNSELAPADRSALAEAQPWDSSVIALAAGFPDVVSRMSEHIDWTQQMGDSVLVDTDAVLAAIQRMRQQALDMGNLATNEAQVINIEAETITINPAEPEVIYVPTYDSATVYSQPAPVVISDGSSNVGEVLATGAILFGTAIILDEIFEDDDDWDGYWHSRPGIDWDDGDFDRPGFEVGGNVNIGNDIDIDISNDNDIGNFGGGGGGLGGNLGRPGQGNGNRPATLPGEVPGRLGDVDGDSLKNRKPKDFSPERSSREAARDRIGKAQGGSAAQTLPPIGAPKDAKLPDRKPGATSLPKSKGPVVAKPSVKPAKVQDKMARPTATAKAKPKAKKPAKGDTLFPLDVDPAAAKRGKASMPKKRN